MSTDELFLTLDGYRVRLRSGVSPCESESPEQLLRRLLQNRGCDPGWLDDDSLRGLLPPDGLGGLEPAARLLAETIRQGGRICVAGDFDADGATSSALAVRALKAMGALDILVRVPDRMRHGYGLTPGFVEELLQEKPHLVLTVDQGISSFDGVQMCQDAGVLVVITDHHLPPQRIPPANAIVNPNLAGEVFPGKHLAGVGVVFYLMMALRRHLDSEGWFDGLGAVRPNLGELLDLVALGTYADLVPLDSNNMTLVRQGMERIRRGRCSPGITALMEVAGRDPRFITSADLGYFVAPRLNAAGRIEEMSLGIECLLADDITQARCLAQRLDDLNGERKEIEQRMQEQAMAQLESADSMIRDVNSAAIVLHDDSWHPGVIGILASRLKERHHRPSVVFTRDADSTLRGSARSIPGFHMRDALVELQNRNPDMMQKFGGHAMAAGLTIERARLHQFRCGLNELASETLSKEQFQAVHLSDGVLPAELTTMECVRLISERVPWGQGIPYPQFHGRFEILSQQIVGAKHLRLYLRNQSTSGQWQGIAFNQAGLAESAGICDGALVDLLYRLEVNRFRGSATIQFNILGMAKVASGANT